MNFILFIVFMVFLAPSALAQSNGSKLKLNWEVMKRDPVFFKSFKRVNNKSGVFAAQSTINNKLIPENTTLNILINNECHGNSFILGYLRKDYKPNRLLSLKMENVNIELKEVLSEKELLDHINKDSCIIEVTNLSKVIVNQVDFNDPFSGQQDYLDSIKAQASIDFFAGKSLSKVKVAIVDTGIDYNHEDLRNQMWRNTDGTFGISVLTNPSTGNTEVTRNPLDTASNSHGTHVAGLVGAESNNGVGVSSIASNVVELMGVKIFSERTGSSADISNGIRWAADNGAEVINLSLGIQGGGYAPDIESAMKYAVSKGSFVVAAAGNDRINITNRFSSTPSSHTMEISGAISVASYDKGSNVISSFSNFGRDFIETAAPGDGRSGSILSTIRGNRYARINGTSMASPIVAGAAVLLKSYLKAKGLKNDPATLEDYMLKGAGVNYNFTNFVRNGKTLNMESMVSFIKENFEEQQDSDEGDDNSNNDDSNQGGDVDEKDQDNEIIDQPVQQDFRYQAYLGRTRAPIRIPNFLQTHFGRNLNQTTGSFGQYTVMSVLMKSSNPNLVYRWFVNGRELLGSNSSTFIIKAVQGSPKGTKVFVLVNDGRQLIRSVTTTIR